MIFERVCIDFAGRLMNLDTMKPGSYKARPLALLVCVLLLAPSLAQAASHRTHGLVLPPGAQEVGEDRYRLPGTYENTLKYFDKAYRGLPQKAIVNQPGIRAMHFESSSAKTAWQGFNVYEKNHEVRIFILTRPAADTPSAKHAKGRSSTGK